MNGTARPRSPLLLFVGHLVLLSVAVTISYSDTTTITGGGSSGDDQVAMDALKKAISTRGNNNLPNWDVKDFCSWDGVTCYDAQFRVKSINLSSKGLTGALPSEALNSLTYLVFLFLQSNNFYGALPCLANLSFLMEIDMSSNSFNTVSPGTFSRLTSLRNLSISNNPHLSPWNFPSGLVSSTSLLTLLASDANINGPIPEFLGSFRSLHTLNLSHNNFTGTIPNALSSLRSLANIDISNNKLSGTMPVFRTGVSVLHAGNDSAIGKESGAKRSSNVVVLKVVLLSIADLVVFSLIILCCVKSKCWMRRWWANQNRFQHSQQDIESGENDNDSSHEGQQDIPGENDNDSNPFSSVLPRKFSYHELVTATGDFRKRLGRGGSGNVFQGILSNGDKVAVKRLQDSDRSAEEFESEVRTLGNARHCNVVRMVGYCVEGEHRLIVYEYMAKGSLDKCIAKKLLTWDNKKNIIKQIAKGLQYLHLECNSKILHRDVKPHNVLLDDDFNAKLSDFGLAQIVSRDRTRSTRGGGTPGYWAPEVCQIGERSLKADVYSYGVVVLEIVFEKKIWAPITPQEDSTPFIELLKTKFNEDKLHDLIVDSMGTGENMLEEMEQPEIKKIVMLALWCLNFNRADRPSMTEVVNVLDGFTSVPEDKIVYTKTPPLSNACTQQHSDYQRSASILSGSRIISENGRERDLEMTCTMV